MDEVLSRLKDIKTERDKLSPEVLKEGLTVFGITGTLQGTARTFSTISEMEQHSDLPEDTFAIVYGTSYIGTYRLDNGNWTQIGDSTQEQQIMDVLNDIDGTTDQYEGVGGTDEEISDVLNQIKGGNV